MIDSRNVTQKDAEMLAAALGEQTGQMLVAVLAIARALKPQEPEALQDFHRKIQDAIHRSGKDKELQRMILESML